MIKFKNPFKKIFPLHNPFNFHRKLPKTKKAFWKKFTIVKAAGGLIENEKNELLMIFRRGKWDLPKGKLDDGETLEQCAIREVKEETGLVKIKLLASLLTTFHTYHEGSKFILKESSWYKMKADSQQILQPQTDEGILEIKWVTLAGAKKLFPRSFPSVIDVIKKIMPPA